jgi:hypothetical protein
VNPDEKQIMYWFAAAILIAPLALWAALRLAVLIGYSVTAETLSLIRLLRWSVLMSAALLLVLYFAGILRLDAWPLATALGGASVGLALPQAWAKERIARSASAAP